MIHEEFINNIYSFCCKNEASQSFHILPIRFENKELPSDLGQLVSKKCAEEPKSEEVDTRSVKRNLSESNSWEYIPMKKCGLEPVKKK
jgi:hypothetical protein